MSSSIDIVSDENASVTTESALASALTICGGSASGGKPRITRAMRSRTSLAAASTSRLTSNSMRTCERSSSLSDSILRMPSMPATESSMICVILVSMIAADAPR